MSTEKTPSQDYRFRCIYCGKCCSDPNTLVNLTYSDINRFQRILKWDMKQTLSQVGFYLFENTPTEEQMKRMVLPPLETQKGPAYLALRKHEDGKCVFLSEKNLCVIHKARPDICRTFPFHFHTSNIKSETKKATISMNITEKGKKYCSGLGEPHPFIDRKRWLVIGKQTVENILKEAILITRWNKAVKDGKIEPSAENYLHVISEMREMSKTDKKLTVKTKKGSFKKKKIEDKEKKKFKQIMKEKLDRKE